MTVSYYHGKDGFGGFSLDNIRNWLVKECMESGNPQAFFWNIKAIVEDMAEDDFPSLEEQNELPEE